MPEAASADESLMRVCVTGGQGDGGVAVWVLVTMGTWLRAREITERREGQQGT